MALTAALLFGLGPEYLYKAKLHDSPKWLQNYERLGLPVGLALLLTLSILFVPKWLDPSRAESARRGRELMMDETEVSVYNVLIDRYNSLLSKVDQADTPNEMLIACREFIEFSSKELPFDSDLHLEATERAKKDSNRFGFRTARLRALYFVALNSPEKAERVVCQGKAIELYQSILNGLQRFGNQWRYGASR